MWIPQEMLSRIRGGSDFHEGHRTQVRVAHYRLLLVTGIYMGGRELWSHRGGEGGEGSSIFLICTHFPGAFHSDLDLEGEKIRLPGAGKMVQLLRASCMCVRT